MRSEIIYLSLKRACNWAIILIPAFNLLRRMCREIQQVALKTSEFVMENYVGNNNFLCWAMPEESSWLGVDIYVNYPH